MFVAPSRRIDAVAAGAKCQPGVPSEEVAGRIAAQTGLRR